jgi:hypothetical protein
MHYSLIGSKWNHKINQSLKLVIEDVVESKSLKTNELLSVLVTAIVISEEDNQFDEYDCVNLNYEGLLKSWDRINERDLLT